MVYSNIFRALFLIVALVFITTSCKKEKPIVFPEVDDSPLNVQGINGTKWADLTSYPTRQVTSLTVIDDVILATFTGGNTAVSALIYNSYYTQSSQSISAFGGGTGIAKVKRVNQKLYGMGQMGNYGLYEYDSTTTSYPWNPISNLNTGVNGFEIVNSISYVGCNSAPYVRYLQSGTWNTVGAGLDNVVNDLISFNGELIAAGTFVNSGSTAVNHIAKWNGSQWVSMDGGLNGNVKGLAVYQGKLVAIGSFTSSTAGNTDCKGVAVWNGATWEPLSNGISGGFYGGLVVSTYKDELFIGGDFTYGGGVYSPNIIKWNGSSFVALAQGLNHPIGAITVHNEQLYVANAVFYLNSNFVLKLEK